MTASDTGAASTAERRRLHPLTPVYDLITAARQFWIVLIPLLRPGRDPSDIVVPVVIALLVLGRITGWLFTSYQLTADALVFDAGVFQRKNRTVPYDRVQQVDVVQKLRHRVLGVARLDVSTAGGGTGKEVRLDVLSVAEARRLQHAIQAARTKHLSTVIPAGTAADSTTHGAQAALAEHAEAAPAAGPAPTDRSATLVRLGVGDLALAGVTGARLVVVLGAAFTLANTLEDLPISFWDRVGETDVPSPTSLTVATSLFAGAVVWFGLAALSSVVTDFGYTVRHLGSRFSVTKGLLARNEVVIPDHRVQSVTLHQSILRRWLDRAAMRVSSAGGHFTIPLVPWSSAVGLLEPFAGSGVLPPLLPAPRAARRRAIVRRVVPALVLSAPLAALLWPVGVAAPAVALPAAAGLGWAAWRGLAHGYDDQLIVARRGAFYRSFVVVPTAKVQSARVVASWFQRRVGLATLFVDVAGGGSAEVPDIEAIRAHRLSETLVIPTRARTADDRRSRSDARPRG